MAIDVKNVLLRILSDPNYAAKGSSLTWTELDTDLKILADNILALQTPSTGGFEPFDNGITYSNVGPDYVSYNGNIYQYINAIPHSGITPGADPLTWQAVSVGQFSHQQNTDQYLDKGGPKEVTVTEIYNKVHESDAFVSGFTYYKGDPLAPVTGDLREGYEPTTGRVELQEYDGATWPTGDNARNSR